MQLPFVTFIRDSGCCLVAGNAMNMREKSMQSKLSDCAQIMDEFKSYQQPAVVGLLTPVCVKVKVPQLSPVWAPVGAALKV